MILQRIKRKLYKLTHPVVGEIWMLHRCVSREQYHVNMNTAEVQQCERNYRVVEQSINLPEQRDLEVTPDYLEKKITEYKSRGYSFVSIDNIFDYHFSFFNSRRWVCITFDDGYRDNYTIAYPLLKRLGVPFAVYVTTGFIDNQLPMWWYPGERLGISKEELIALDADPLCSIGAHTVSHPQLDTLTRDQQYQEIANSKQTLESLLGHEVHHFSFPHGAYNNDTLAICKKLGFKTTVKSWGGEVRLGVDKKPLPRIIITEN